MKATGPVAVAPLTRAEWAELAPAFRDHNYRQAWAFGRACAERLGATSEHVALRRGEELLGLADVRVRTLPLGLGGIAYVNGGPLLRRRELSEEDEPERLRAALEALVREYRDRRGLLLRVQAPVGEPAWNEHVREAYRELGLEASAGHASYRTFLVDLAPPLEDIRKGLRQKWRNGLNAAERAGLRVESGTGPELFDTFCNLFQSFSERKPFEVDLTPEFYAAVQRDQLEGERYRISLALQEGEPVAGHVSSLDGDTCVYLLGATLPAALRSKAAYLLQWHTIETARADGARWYDLGGIDPEGNPGVYRFKSGLGGTDVTAAGPAELAPEGLRGRLPRLAEQSYQQLRRLRARAARSGGTS